MSKDVMLGTHRVQPKHQARCVKKVGNKVLISRGNSLVVQLLRLRPSTAGGTGSNPGRGTRILMLCCVAKKKKSLDNLSEVRSWGSSKEFGV